MDKITTAIIDQLDTLGFCGVSLLLALVAIVALWGELLKARTRNKELADNLYNMAKETTIMIERITGR